MERHIQEADIILLLLSAKFLDTSRELWHLALRLRETQGTSIIPILLRPVILPDEFHGLQALPRNREPIVTWNNVERAYQEIAQEVNAIIERLQSGLNLHIPLGSPTLSDSSRLPDLSALPRDTESEGSKQSRFFLRGRAKKV